MGVIVDVFPECVGDMNVDSGVGVAVKVVVFCTVVGVVEVHPVDKIPAISNPMKIVINFVTNHTRFVA